MYHSYSYNIVDALFAIAIAIAFALVGKAIERVIKKRSKLLLPQLKQYIIGVITLQGAKEKNAIIDIVICTIFFLHFKVRQ